MRGVFDPTIPTKAIISASGLGWERLSLAALAAAVFAPIFDGFLFGPHIIALAIVVMSSLLVWRHRGNIAKLMRGEESRSGDKKKAAAAASAGAGDDR